MRRSWTQNTGFTLIELLVTVAIIGILAAIAIPQFESYRARGFDSRSVQDLRNGAIAQEAYFSEYEHYVDCIGSAACVSNLPQFRSSSGVTVDMFRVQIPNTAEYFTARAYHARGVHKNPATAFYWNSIGGGLQ